MARVVGLSDDFFDLVSRPFRHRDVNRASIIVTGLLNGLLADDIAERLRVNPPVVETFLLAYVKI